MTSDIRQDTRFEHLQRWLDQVLPNHGELVPASSDASFRRYFRVFSDQLANSGASGSAIVMDAPPPQEDCRPFVEVCARLDQAGVRAPRVIEQDLEQGFLLLDDLGSTTLLAALPQLDPQRAYQKAMDSLLRIQGAAVADLPVYDAGLLLRELNLFHDWYLGVHRQRLLSVAEQQAWDTLCQQLIARALQQTQVFVHRDYHSRNLMWAEDQALGVLDFQDAVRGPISYDLVSLLRDCYVAWPAEQVQAWLDDYHAQASAAIATLTRPPAAATTPAATIKHLSINTLKT